MCTATTIGAKSIPVCTIQPAKALPVLLAPSTYIDGYSQPKAVPNSHALAAGDNAVIAVGLDGTHLLGGNGLAFRSAYDSVEGLAMTNMPSDGVYVGGPGNVFDIVAGNFIGLKSNGAATGPNGNGVQITDGSSFATTGGRAIVDPNVISGNTSYGVQTSGAGANAIRENMIGINPAGTAPVANGYDGVFLYGTLFDQVGGFRPGEGNVISGNFNDGIDGLDTKLASINGNVVGMNGSSKKVLANGYAGIFLYLGSNNLVGGVPFGFGGNVIAGNAADGVDVLAETGDFVGGNVIGYAAPNQGNGVMVGNTYSFTDPYMRHAKGLLRRTAALYRVRTDSPVVGGETPLLDSVSNNIIAANGGSGVLVGQAASDSDTHVLIYSNSMISNGAKGIMFFGSGVGCAGFRPGPNDGTPCPSISSVSTSAVSGFSCASCAVQVFLSSNEAAARGFGEGYSFLGTTTADGSGNWTLNLASGAVSSGQYVTATATQAVPGYPGNLETSQFAFNTVAQGSAPIRRSAAARATKLRQYLRGINQRQPVRWRWLGFLFNRSTVTTPRVQMRILSH